MEERRVSRQSDMTPVKRGGAIVLPNFFDLLHNAHTLWQTLTKVCVVIKLDERINFTLCTVPPPPYLGQNFLWHEGWCRICLKPTHHCQESLLFRFIRISLYDLVKVVQNLMLTILQLFPHHLNNQSINYQLCTVRLTNIN